MKKRYFTFYVFFSIMSFPMMFKNIVARRLKEGIGSKEDRKIKVGSLCSEHNWSCVENQR